MKLKSSALIAALLLSGCASVEMAPKADSAKAKNFSAPTNGNAGVYIYRNGFLGKALKRNLWINGECIGESAPDTFFYTQVPGNKAYELATESEFSPNTLGVSLDANKNYFFRQYIKMGLIVGGSDLEVIPEEQGKQDISKLEMAQGGKCSGSMTKGGKATDAAPVQVSPLTSTPTAAPTAAPAATPTPAPAPTAIAKPAPVEMTAPVAAPSPTATNAADTAPNTMTRAPLPATEKSSKAEAMVSQVKAKTNDKNSPSTNAKSADKGGIQLVDFVLGTSSMTVERLAKERSCEGGKGAGLVSPKGSRELYKMQCADGRVLMAKCELRQCSVLSIK